MWESGAITEYILERHKNGGLKPAVDAPEYPAYLIGNFSAADTMLGHAAVMSNRLGCVPDEMTNLKAYVARLEARPAFQKADSVGK